VIAGNQAVSQDVPPFAATRYGKFEGCEAVGCRRPGRGRDVLTAIRAPYPTLRRKRLVGEAVAEIERAPSPSGEVEEIVEFIRTSKLGNVPTLNRRHGVEEEVEA